MKQYSLSIVVVLLSAACANAQEAHKAWAKFFAGTWEISGGNGVAEMNMQLAAKESALIGTTKDDQGRESAWIFGWDNGKQRMIHGWFGEDGDIGGVSYKIEDNDTLRGPGVSRSSQGEMKGTVTVRRTGNNRYTVQWTDVTLDGAKADDLNLVVERKRPAGK
jgi:hypothetical protein